MKIDIVVAVNDDKIFAKNMGWLRYLPRPCNAFITQRNFTNVPLAYNEAMKECESDIVCFVHQDVFLPIGWMEQVEEQINKIENWGVLGVAGAKLVGGKFSYVGHVRDRGSEWGKADGLPAGVDTLDELLLIIQNDGKLKFDENIPTNHFTGQTFVCKLEGRA